MIKEEKTAQEIIIKHRHCDDCGNEINNRMACNTTICEICHKDICRKCIGYEAENSGDYRTVYCNKCWNIGEPYRQKIKEYEYLIDILHDEWINKCK